MVLSYFWAANFSYIAARYRGWFDKLVFPVSALGCLAAQITKESSAENTRGRMSGLRFYSVMGIVRTSSGGIIQASIRADAQRKWQAPG